MTKRATSAVVVAGLVAAVALLAAGCGGSSSDAGGTTAATTGTTPAKQIKVGLTTDVGELNDNGFNELAYNGLKRAERELGVKGRVVESNSSADYVPNMSALARQGYNLIIGVGFAQGDAIAKAALKYPNTKFAIVDVDHADLKGNPANVVGLLFREQEVGYLVGYLAALEAKRGGANQISAVGGFKQPPVDRYIAGYKAGAQAAVPGMKVRWAYSQEWDDQAKCKELALNQIAAGAQVIFADAGACGLGVDDAAKEKGIWALGGDADQSYLGPHMLSSELKKVDVAVYATINSLVHNRFKPNGNATFTTANGGIGIGKISPKVPRSIVTQVLAVKKKMAEGKIQHIPTAP